MDVVYTLIGFTLGLVATSVIVMIGQGIINGFGMFFYPLLYNSYEAVYNQIPANATNIQNAINTTFQNSINYISQTETSAATAINTLRSLGSVLEIIAVIGAFIIILEILMRLTMSRNEDAPAGY